MAKILHAQGKHTWLIISVKFFFYDLKLNHYTSVKNGRTDGRTTHRAKDALQHSASKSNDINKHVYSLKSKQ